MLLSGGDSFLNSNETIARYLDALTPIGHLNYIRFGTRTPVTWPERIDERSAKRSRAIQRGKRSSL